MDNVGALAQQENSERERAGNKPQEPLPGTFVSSLATHLEMRQGVPTGQLRVKQHVQMCRNTTDRTQGGAQQNGPFF